MSTTATPLQTRRLVGTKSEPSVVQAKRTRSVKEVIDSWQRMTEQHLQELSENSEDVGVIAGAWPEYIGGLRFAFAREILRLRSLRGVDRV